MTHHNDRPVQIYEAPKRGLTPAQFKECWELRKITEARKQALGRWKQERDQARRVAAEEAAAQAPDPAIERAHRKQVREQRQQTKNTLLMEKKRAACAVLHQQQLEEHDRAEAMRKETYTRETAACAAQRASLEQQAAQHRQEAQQANDKLQELEAEMTALNTQKLKLVAQLKKVIQHEEDQRRAESTTTTHSASFFPTSTITGTVPGVGVQQKPGVHDAHHMLPPTFSAMQQQAAQPLVDEQEDVMQE